MSFSAIVNRVRAEFVEMPGLELSLPQAVRLWTLGTDDCRMVIDALVDAGFEKTRIVLQQWNRSFRPSQMRLDGR